MREPFNMFLKAGPASLNLNALRRWFKEAPVREVAYRFLKVFNNHGVKNTQIQRLVPEITLDRVSGPETLLPELTDDVLTKTAEIFGIERAWLDGVQAHLYHYHHCYQNPLVFFEVFKKVSKPLVWYPLRAFCVDPNLDARKVQPQPLVLIFAEKICDWDDGDELVRFIPFTEEWNWSNIKSRLQLKATIRSCHDFLNILTVPLYQVDVKTLIDLGDGKVIPPDIRYSRVASLEDYVLSPDESYVSKESKELESVFSWMESMEMEELAKKAIRNDNQPDKESDE